MGQKEEKRNVSVKISSASSQNVWETFNYSEEC